MATVIRPKISERNKYWIGKHRHYELKHYCLQYPNWKRLYSDLNGSLQTSLIDSGYRSSIPGDPTGNTSVKRLQLSEKIKKIEDTAKKADLVFVLLCIAGVVDLCIGYDYL